MNLLTDKWIPLRVSSKMQKVSLGEVLCQDMDGDITCFRDDMEMAVLQILVSIVQSIFIPENAQKLIENQKTPLAKSVFEKAIKPVKDWFDLNHLEHPFMQIRDIKKVDITPIQKLFNGLPEGVNHTHWNRQGEIQTVCASCAAIMIFNQASCTPAFGGGYMNPLRGWAPMTTLVKGSTLRQTIWRNVLHKEFADKLYSTKSETPVWVTPIHAGDVVDLGKISLLRALFWQPAHILFQWQHGNQVCDSCGDEANPHIIGFNKEKFSQMSYENSWIHPHSPYIIVEAKDRVIIKCMSYQMTKPTWLQLNSLVWGCKQNKEEFKPAIVVQQFIELFPDKPLDLIIGGYANKQSAVILRKHEMFSLPEGFEQHRSKIEKIIDLVSSICDSAVVSIKGFNKAVGTVGLESQMLSQIYNKLEYPLFKAIADVCRNQPGQEYIFDRSQSIVQNAFDDVTKLYVHLPRGAEQYALRKNKLGDALGKLRNNFLGQVNNEQEIV